LVDISTHMVGPWHALTLRSKVSPNPKFVVRVLTFVMWMGLDAEQCEYTH